MKNKTDKEDLTWNLSLLFSGDDDESIEKEKEEIKKAILDFEEKWRDRDDYLSDPKVLKEALDDYEEIMKKYGVSGEQGFYFQLRRAQNQDDPELKAKLNKIVEFSNKMKDKIRFFGLRLTKIPEDKQDELLESDHLSSYRNFLKHKFNKSEFTLEESEERIMSLKRTSSYSNWVSMVSDFLSREEREVLTEEDDRETKTFEEALNLTRSKNKEVRDSAAEAVNDILESNSDIAEAEFNSVLQDKKVNDNIRGISRPDLMRFINDDVEPEVVDTLIETVSDNFDVSSDYYKLKSNLLGVDSINYYERSIEYGFVDKKYSFKEACDLIDKVFNDLDGEFKNIFNSFVEEGRVDVYPRKGKSGGAFCAPHFVTSPVYVLLNFTKTLNDVTIFAHELGHGINYELMKRDQNALNFGTTLATAEVASTFFEDFVIDEIMKEADDELRLALMMEKLDTDVSNIFRQSAAIIFERKVHEEFRKKGHLSKEDIGELFQEHMKDYMGDYVEFGEGSENWWVYWSHLRRFFYNYSYSSGLLISKALQRKVKEDSEFIENVKEFLSTGTSKSPKEIFSELGIDITKESFWQSGINETKDLLKETEKLARDLGKID